MLPAVLFRKPSGLTLLRLSCGCEQWVRRLSSGYLHIGRRAKSCGGSVHATPDFSMRLSEAIAATGAV